MTCMPPRTEHIASIRISRDDIRSQNGDGYRYTICKEGCPECPGRVTLIFREVGSYRRQSYYKTNNIFDECITRGLKPSDVIGHIRMFYPNGDRPTETVMRQGVGGIILDTLVADTVDKHGKLLYVLPTTHYMKNFVIKRLFTQCGMFKDQYYLTLTIPDAMLFS